MKCLKLGQKIIFKALSVAVLLGAFTVFMGGWAFAAEKTVAEQILDILLANHEISQAQYDALLKQAEAEKLAAAQKIAEAQRAAAAPVERKPTDLNAAWQNGLRLSTDDKAFDIHIGGRTQVDFADAQPNTALKNWANGLDKTGFSSGQKTDGYGDQLRRVRLAVDGTLWRNIEFITQVDFAPSYTSTTDITRTITGGNQPIVSLTSGPAVSFADVWVGVKDIPYIGRIRVGQMYEPMSLEQLTSDNFTTFMEKSLPVNALVPNRNTGVVVQNTACDNRFGWMVGYFFQQQVGLSTNGVPQDTTGDLFSPELDATNVAARFTALPWYEDNGAKLLHIGIGYEHKFRSNADLATLNPGTVDFKSSPEANIFSPLVDSQNFLAKGVNTIDPEIALVCGPFSVQAEFMMAWVNGAQYIHSNSTDTDKPPNLDAPVNATFYGWYAYASYFITGEHRMYNKTTSPSDYQAAFGRIIPNCNFNPLTGGTGAWEVAFRVSNLDVNDVSANPDFNGGNEMDYTAAVNWYLNPNVMVKFNYIYAHVNAHPDGYGNLLSNGNDNIFETRFQIAF